jgi:hypothetical protein
MGQWGEIEMSDLQKTIELLELKSNEAIYLASLPYGNNEILPWRRNIEDILESAFGVTSTEYKRVADFHVTLKGNREERQRDYKMAIHRIQQELNTIIQKYTVLGMGTRDKTITDESHSVALETLDAKTNWEAIEEEFGVTKRNFGIRINFVSDKFKRKIIFRDVEHSFILASQGFSKPAVIIAGSVIEELLRLYLMHNNVTPQTNTFDGYIKTCEQNRLLKNSVSRLSDSTRQFRNLVHLSAEVTARHTISKATAKGAVSSIFTIANDF